MWVERGSNSVMGASPSLNVNSGGGGGVGGSGSRGSRSCRRLRRDRTESSFASSRRSRNSAVLTVVLLGVLFPAAALAGWIDPASEEGVKTRTSPHDGREYRLVMSDEFETEGRNFDDGYDPMWTAETHQDDAMTNTGLGALHYYNASFVTSNNGYLNLTTVAETTQWKGYNPFKKKYEMLKKEFKSGMVNSWNKFCFTGGYIEISARLPGDSYTGGLWPAFWLLGNLGRATYEASTNLVWPWSYNECNRDLQLAQETSACSPLRHFGFNPYQGRGSTEIDVLEAMPGPNIKYKGAQGTLDPIGSPYMSHTLQVAPGIPEHRPTNGEKIDRRYQKWYEGIEYGTNVTANYHFYGMLIDKTEPQEPVYRSPKQSYKADAISALTSISETYFKEFHRYGLEWQPGPEGYLIWYRDDVKILQINAPSLDLTGAQIPEEPSYIILNTAVSSSWGFPSPCPEGCTCECYDCNDPDCACSFYDGFCKMLPSSFLIDYVRVFQTEDPHQTVGCNPPNFPTRRYIASHKGRYTALNRKEPLKKVPNGGGSCSSDEDCLHGTCEGFVPFFKTCSCQEGYTGPLCVVPDYHDDVVFDEDIDFMPPHKLEVPHLLFFLSLTFVAAVTVSTFIVGRNNARARRAYDSELKKAKLPRR